METRGSDNTVVPLVSAEDAARVAVGALTNPSLESGSSYQVIGNVLRLREIVGTFERVLGRKVRYQEIPDEAWATAALSRGLNRHAVEHLSKLWQSIRTQAPTFEVTDTILELGGQQPKTFEEFVREQQGAFTAQPAEAAA
jgi:uncharacterized protein YbjT (DUF2867 family)